MPASIPGRAVSCRRPGSSCVPLDTRRAGHCDDGRCPWERLLRHPLREPCLVSKRKMAMTREKRTAFVSGHLALCEAASGALPALLSRRCAQRGERPTDGAVKAVVLRSLILVRIYSWSATMRSPAPHDGDIRCKSQSNYPTNFMLTRGSRLYTTPKAYQKQHAVAPCVDTNVPFGHS